jgi:flagellar protein FlgJ
MAGSAAAQLGLSIATLDAAQNARAQAALTNKGQAKTAAENFESMFLQTVFQQMFSGIDGEGPFGGSGALKVWRSMLTDQYAKTFAQTGGLGIASHVYDQLLKQQGASGA